MTRLLTSEKSTQFEKSKIAESPEFQFGIEDDKVEEVFNGDGKCTVGGCSCPSYVDPPGGFNCSRCGHKKSDHW